MMVLDVAGMTCGHCVKAVEAAVRAAAPGAGVSVDLASGRVTVAGPADAAAIGAAIAAAGYEVRGTDAGPLRG